jgi:peptidoglycan/xylan/chitin deacetylase (PgdA/CDA1 family)
MKRMWAILAVLLCLTACGGPIESSAEVSAAPSAESWGVSDVELSLAPTATPTPEPSEEPTPTPTPEPESLRELVSDTIPVYVDGQCLSGLILADTTLVLQDEAAEILDLPGELDLTWQDWTAYDGQGGVTFRAENWVPVRWLSQALGLELLWDQEQGAVYLTTPIGAIPAGQKVPVLMYHAVSDDLWGIHDLFVSPAELEKQLAYLTENGYTPIFFSDLPKVDEISKPVLLTFDDGYEDNYTNLFPLLQQYGVKATCFVITGMLEDEHYLTAAQVQEMAASGLVDIQSHTVDHEDLESLSRADQEYQLAQSRLELARLTGKLPTVLAYPSGSRNGDTLDLAAAYYSLGIDMNGGTWNTSNSRYQVSRIYISRVDRMTDFANKVP